MILVKINEKGLLLHEVLTIVEYQNYSSHQTIPLVKACHSVLLQLQPLIRGHLLYQECQTFLIHHQDFHLILLIHLEELLGPQDSLEEFLKNQLEVN